MYSNGDKVLWGDAFFPIRRLFQDDRNHLLRGDQFGVEGCNDYPH